jgi:transcriptional regulator with XRE-family HTH domain
LAEHLKRLRLERQLTQERLAERASLIDPSVTVSVDTVRALERLNTPRPLPRRRPSRDRFTLELVLEALDADVAETLCSCFSDEELRQSSFSWVVERRRKLLDDYHDILHRRSLADFIEALPATVGELLALPGVINLRNAEAFSYIFALERCYDGLEMLVVNEPPIALLLEEDVQDWAKGMKLQPQDRYAFLEQVSSYQRYFRTLATSGSKRYQVVLSKRGLERFLSRRTAARVAEFLNGTVSLLEEAPGFELVLLDSPAQLEELEVISRHQTIPTTLSETLSVVIRQNSMSADDVEYCLVPMPPLLSSLQRDIAKIEQHWSLALDQYRSLGSPDEYWLNTSGVTARLLRGLHHR